MEQDNHPPRRDERPHDDNRDNRMRENRQGDNRDESASKDKIQNQAKGRAPSMIAYSVKDRGQDQDSIWKSVGAAFPHCDGKGMDVVLDAVPVDGRVTLREQRREEFKEKRREGQSQARSQDRSSERGKTQDR